MFRFAHHTWSRRYGLDDFGSNLLSLALVFLVLIYVYPLRMMFGSLFAWLSMLTMPPAWQVPWTFSVHGYGDIRVMFVIYGVAWSTLGCVIALLYRQAWKRRRELDLDLDEAVATSAEVARWLVVPATGALSIALAIAVPAEAPALVYGAPGFAYIAMFLTGPVARRRARRVRQRLLASG
jgi:hypothetical protein